MRGLWGNSANATSPTDAGTTSFISSHRKTVVSDVVVNQGTMDRFHFGKLLDSIVIPDGTPSEEIVKAVLPIREAVAEMMPKSLFRFRSCDDMHIDAFENDSIYAVTADSFNDPYDTLQRYDMDGIRQYVNRVMSIEGLEQLKAFFAQGYDFADEVKMMLPEKVWENLKSGLQTTKDLSSLKDRIEASKEQVLLSISVLFPILSSFGKRFSTIACFSEDVKSILMWSHYADSHKGFALEYDFRHMMTKPLERGMLYPVVYSDERYDASVYITWQFMHVLGFHSKNPDITAFSKIAVHKSKVWEYEREWRIIDPGPHDPIHPNPTVIHYKPIAIYYGENIPKDKQERLHQIAAVKGIREYKMDVDETDKVYEMRVREC